MSGRKSYVSLTSGVLEAMPCGKALPGSQMIPLVTSHSCGLATYATPPLAEQREKPISLEKQRYRLCA